MEQKPGLETVSDDDLLRRLSDLVGQSRRIEADLAAHIAELDERRLPGAGSRVGGALRDRKKGDR